LTISRLQTSSQGSKNGLDFAEKPSLLESQGVCGEGDLHRRDWRQAPEATARGPPSSSPRPGSCRLSSASPARVGACINHVLDLRLNNESGKDYGRLHRSSRVAPA
jgi:hypothetical protein